jgi:hypothetical protein
VLCGAEATEAAGAPVDVDGLVPPASGGRKSGRVRRVASGQKRLSYRDGKRREVERRVRW